MSGPGFDRLVIATRESALALWQSNWVKEELERQHAGLRVELLPMTTQGDQMLDARLDRSGGKGLFIKELEVALSEQRADIAVHSMKDLPADLPEGFSLAAITAREDPRDALVSARYGSLAALPRGAALGTASLRRAAQILEQRPDLEIRVLRGNVLTRLAKVGRGEYDAAILALAGLKRLGVADRVREVLGVERSLPAVGQGALGIECLSARREIVDLVAVLEDRPTSRCVRAERAVSRALGGNCALPLAAHAEPRPGSIHLRALVASADGRRVVRAEAEGPAGEPEALGNRVADELRGRGAEAILGVIRA